MVNSKATININKHRKMMDFLKENGMTMQSGVVIDTSMPLNSHRIVGNVDFKSIDLEQPLTLDLFPQIEHHLKTGRTERTQAFFAEQESASKWANRQD